MKKRGGDPYRKAAKWLYERSKDSRIRYGCCDAIRFSSPGLGDRIVSAIAFCELFSPRDDCVAGTGYFWQFTPADLDARMTALYLMAAIADEI